MKIVSRLVTQVGLLVACAGAFNAYAASNAIFLNSAGAGTSGAVARRRKS